MNIQYAKTGNDFCNRWYLGKKNKLYTKMLKDK